MLEIGKKAPDFSILDKDGNVVRLSDHLGNKVASHQKIAAKYDLPFVLASDPELQAIQAYGVWQEKKLYGKDSMGVVRTTFIIDEQGN